MSAADMARYLVALSLVVLILGCAPMKALPECDRFAAQLVLDSGGNPYICLDMENAEKLRTLILSASQGACRLPE